MPFVYLPAKLENVGLFIAIAGGSRTGKTYTALRLARGIAGPNGRIAAIDTEGKRMSHYKPEFQFDVVNMLSPFSPHLFVEAARTAQDALYDVLVIDSFSLEWSGVGGVLDLFDDYFAEVKFNEKWKDICWARAKKPHKAMLNELIQLTIPIVFCLRANEVLKHLGGGWKVEQDKRFLYEWTVALTLHPDTPGMPRFDMVDSKQKPLWKLEDQHRSLFPVGKLIGEEAGAALQAWRNSDAARQMGNQAVRSERKQTFSDWLESFESDLDHAETDLHIERRVVRDDVRKVIETASPDVRKRIDNAVIQAKARLERARLAPAAGEDIFPGDRP